MKIGTNNIALSLGGDMVEKVFLGDELVFNAGSETKIKLTDYLQPLVVGAAWGAATNSHGRPDRIGTNNARASTEALIDISEVALLLGEIKLTPKTGYRFLCYFGNNVPNDNIVTWAYTNSGNTLVVDISNCTHAMIMVARTDNAVLSSTNWSTYLIEE